jgi:hypothetical protein
MTNYKISLTKVLAKIREKFGDGKIFLTLVAFQPDGEPCSISTFAEDNIKELVNWTALFQTKLFSGSIMMVAIVLRVFLPEQYETENKGKKIKIPGKDLYNFYCTKAGCEGFTEQETFENQTTDPKDRANMLAPEPWLFYKNSEKILEEFVEEIAKGKDKG